MAMATVAICVITFARWHDDRPQHVRRTQCVHVLVLLTARKEIIHKYYLLSWFSVISFHIFICPSSVLFSLSILYETRIKAPPTLREHTHIYTIKRFLLFFLFPNRNRYFPIFLFLFSMCIVELWISIHGAAMMSQDNLTGCVCVWLWIVISNDISQQEA